MSKWWEKKWGKDQICGISYNRLKCGTNKNGVLLSTTLKCNHRFCTEPLLKWFSINNSCPICRENIKLEDILMFHYEEYLKKNKVSGSSKYQQTLGKD